MRPVDFESVPSPVAVPHDFQNAVVDHVAEDGDKQWNLHLDPLPR